MSFVEDLFGLAGKTAIVSGGAGVIGTVMSEALLQAGANVVIWDCSQDFVDQALDKLGTSEALSARLFGDRVDTGSESQVEAAIKRAYQKFGHPDILINGVGGNIGKAPIVETEIDQFEKVLHLNLIAGLMVPTKIMAAYWIEQKVKGAIINLTSMASYNPLSGVWAYDAAKAGVLNLTVGMANELAPHGIRVNAIAPGFFLGKQNRALLVNEETGEYTPRGQAVINHTPYGRFGEAKELVGATLFLASSKASGFVTGVSIPVDGGYLAFNI